MNKHEIESFRTCMIDNFKGDFGDLPRKCGVDKMTELLPSVSDLEKLLANTNRDDAESVLAITFQALINNIAKALGCSISDASQLASECLMEQLPLIKQLSKES